MPHQGLTSQEREVLALAAAGLDNAGIAARLGIGARTVGTYWRRIYQRLGLTGRDRPREQALHAWRELAARGAPPGAGEGDA